MRILPGKRIIVLYITSLVLALGLLGWFFIGSNWTKPADTAIVIPPGSTVDTACQAVYRQVKTQGFAGHRIMAQGDFKIEKAVLLTGQAAKKISEIDPATPDDARFCYVLVRGYPLKKSGLNICTTK